MGNSIDRRIFLQLLSGSAGSVAFSSDTSANRAGPAPAYIQAFTADGRSDDTRSWAGLREAHPSSVIDCAGLKFKVAAIPEGPVCNGWWVMDEYGGAVSVAIPMPDTVRATRQRLTNSKRYSAWPQDKAHVYNGVVYAAYNEGRNHTGSNGDMSAWCCRSYDGGFTYSQYERIASDPEEQRFSFAAGVAKGQQLFIIRHGNRAVDSELVGRRLFERRNSVTCRVTTKQGLQLAVFSLAGLGVKVGDVVKITLFDPLGGIDFSGEYPVSAVSASGFTVKNAKKATRSLTEERSFRIEFKESEPSSLDISGLSLDKAVQAASGKLFTSSLTLFHSFATDENDNPAVYTTTHGGGSVGTYLVKIADVLLPSRSIAWIRRLHTEGVEATVARVPGTTRLVGAIRSQDTASYPARLWFSDDELAGPAHFIDVPGNGFAEQSPIPCRVAGEYVYWFFSGKRTRDGTAGSVGLYLVKVNTSQLTPSTRWSDLQVIRIGQAYYSAMSVNAVGVPSMAALGDALILMYSSEHPPVVGDFDGQPDIYTIRLQLAQNGDIASFNSDANADYPLTFSAPWTDPDNVVAPIEAAHGFPSGGILERGENEQGSYIKFRDGTLECWSDNLVLAFNDKDTLNAIWTFPAEFAGPAFATTTLPHDTQSYHGISRTACGAPYSSTGMAAVELGFNRAAGAPELKAGDRITSCKARAIGRWY